MRKLSQRELVERQKSNQRLPRLPFNVVLNNIRSLYNVGSIFRCADGAGIEKIWLCGITGYPPQSQISKTALGAENHVSWEYRKNAVEVIRHLKQIGYQIVVLEQTINSLSYQNFRPCPPVCLLIGNEIEGISDSLIGLSDRSVEIEMAGLKNSLNVSVAFGIVAYHFRYCLMNSKTKSPWKAGPNERELVKS